MEVSARVSWPVFTSGLFSLWQRFVVWAYPPGGLGSRRLKGSYLLFLQASPIPKEGHKVRDFSKIILHLTLKHKQDIVVLVFKDKHENNIHVPCLLLPGSVKHHHNIIYFICCPYSSLWNTILENLQAWWWGLEDWRVIELFSCEEKLIIIIHRNLLRRAFLNSTKVSAKCHI